MAPFRRARTELRRHTRSAGSVALHSYIGPSESVARRTWCLMLRTAPTSWAWWLDGASPAPKPPTRDQLCAVKMSFQGLTFNTPSYGNVYWWETIAWWPNPADRQAAYVAKRAAGDTHIIIDLSG